MDTLDERLKRKKDMLKAITSGKEEVKKDENAWKKVKYSTKLSKAVVKLLDAIKAIEEKQYCELIEEAILEYFRKKWKEYNEVEKSFIELKVGKDLIRQILKE